MSRTKAPGSRSSSRPGTVETTILGRPVLPPDAGAFQQEATAAGSGSSESPGSGENVAGTTAGPGATSSKPATIAGCASSIRASRSGRDSERATGRGVAPNFQTAYTASMNGIPLGNPIIARDPAPRPSAR